LLKNILKIKVAQKLLKIAKVAQKFLWLLAEIEEQQAGSLYNETKRVVSVQ